MQLVTYVIFPNKRNYLLLIICLLLLVNLNSCILIFGSPISTTSVHNHRYFLTILDDYSRFVWIVLLKSKSEVSQHVKNFISLIENQFHITPKAIMSNNGPEFLLHSLYASKGILDHRSCVETPQQNGRVE